MATKTKKNQPILDTMPGVTVEYDYGSKGERRTKEFDDANEGKTFYTAKEKAGKNPKVVKPGKAPATATKTTTPTAKAEAAKPAPVPAAAKAPGVRAVPSRPYLAGTIIAKYGLAAGVTEAMVAELDVAYGKPNPRESQFCLKNAWHSCRAFAGAEADAIQ